jgi:hypothetical protein
MTPSKMTEPKRLTPAQREARKAFGAQEAEKALSVVNRKRKTVLSDIL